MDVGKEDFEAGVYGNSIELVMQSLSDTQPLTETQVQAITGLTTESLAFALAKLQELGKIEQKLLGASKYYAAISPVPPQDWYTINESAGYLRISRRTMYKLIHDGQLTAYRVGMGGHRRFRRDDLEQLMSPEESEPADVMTAVADPVLAELWDNAKDAAYDNL
jgi:excisionase family DNA binding protein